MHGSVIRSAQKARSCQAICSSAESGLTIVNSLSWDRKALVELPNSIGKVLDSSGQLLPTQNEAGKTWAEVKVPPALDNRIPTIQGTSSRR